MHLRQEGIMLSYSIFIFFNHMAFLVFVCFTCDFSKPHFSQQETLEIKNCFSRSILNTVFMICFPNSGLSAACFQSKFNLIKKTNQLDSDLASIFCPSVMSQALAHTLFRFIIKIYNGEKLVIIKNHASHTREY